MNSIPIALIRLVGHMQNWQKLHYKPYHLFLSQKAMEQASREGYVAFAQLIKAGYFSVIVTTHSTALLEHSLKSVKLEFTVLAIGEEANEQILPALEGLIDRVCIITLPQDYKEESVMMAPLSSALNTALRDYLNRDLIVVGPIAPNSRLMKMIQSDLSGSTYYCIHEQTSSDDIIIQLLDAKYSQKDEFLVYGEYGHFNVFFPTIASLLHPKKAGPEISLGASLLPKQRQVTPPTNTKRSGSRNTIDQKADILLVTVTEIETQALLNRFPSAEKHISDQVYYDFGSIGLAHTVMVRSTHMGPFSAIHCVEKGIDHFSPRIVIMAGIAFGLHPDEQNIGDILVAKQIVNWDFQKIRTGPDNEPVTIPRGTAIPVTDRLLNCFQAHQLESKPPPHIHFGAILSSSRLIDHEGTRKELSRYFPEAIGGEMEGHGLCDVCSRKKVDWILVKAICDWADGNKDEDKESRQRLAADNAARFVLSVIEQYGLL